MNKEDRGNDTIFSTFQGKERMPFRSFFERTPGGKESNLFQTNENLLLRGCVRGRLGLLIGPFVFGNINEFRRISLQSHRRRIRQADS